MPGPRLTLRTPCTRRTNHPAMGTVTTPLVELLHRRSELRDIVPVADLIDSALRESA